MPAKIITLSQKDQDLLRVALTLSVDCLPDNYELATRIKDLKDRLLI